MTTRLGPYPPARDVGHPSARPAEPTYPDAVSNWAQSVSTGHMAGPMAGPLGTRERLDGRNPNLTQFLWQGPYGDAMKATGRGPTMEHTQVADGFVDGTQMIRVWLKTLTKAEQYPISLLLPLQYNDSLHFQLVEFVWKPGQLDATPEEGPPRTLRQIKQTFEANMNRFSKGVEFSREALMEPERGQLEKAMALKTLAQTFLNTMCNLAMQAIMSAPPPRSPDRSPDFGGSMHRSALDAIMARESARWAMLQKSRHGIHILISDLSRTLAERGVPDADVLVVPQGLSFMVSMRDENALSYMSGRPGGPTAPKLNVSVIESATYAQDESHGVAPSDWTQDEVTIGDYFVFGAPLISKRVGGRIPTAGIAYAEDNVDRQGTFVFDETANDYVFVSMRTGVENCGLFDTTKANWPLTELGCDWVNEVAAATPGLRLTWGAWLKRANLLDSFVKMVMERKLDGRFVRTDAVPGDDGEIVEDGVDLGSLEDQQDTLAALRAVYPEAAAAVDRLHAVAPAVFSLMLGDTVPASAELRTLAPWTNLLPSFLGVLSGKRRSWDTPTAAMFIAYVAQAASTLRGLEQLEFLTKAAALCHASARDAVGRSIRDYGNAAAILRVVGDGDDEWNERVAMKESIVEAAEQLSAAHGIRPPRRAAPRGGGGGGGGDGDGYGGGGGGGAAAARGEEREAAERLAAELPVALDPTAPESARYEALQASLDAILVVDGSFVKFCLDHNLICPLGMYGFRPYATYRMGSAFMTKSGGALGHSFISRPDMTIGEDGTLKRAMMHFSVWAKPVVMNPSAIAFARSVVSLGVLGGGGLQPWRYRGETDLLAHRQGNRKADVFFVAQPPWVDFNRAAIDISGAFAEALNVTSDDENLHYYGARAYANYWGWDSNAHAMLGPYESPYGDAYAAPCTNTICCPTKQLVWSEGHGFVSVMQCSGHWGDFIYPGCVAVRRGEQFQFASPKNDSSALHV